MKDVLNEDQIDISIFSQNGLDASCAHGAYREILCKPKDVVWDYVEFNIKDRDILNPHYLIPGQLELELPEVDKSQ